jgi:hypothetical protein
MRPITDRYHVAVAASYGADILTYQADLTRSDAERLEGLLRGLADLGHVVSYTMAPATAAIMGAAAFDALRRRWGFVVDAVLPSQQAEQNLRPAYLMPVWPFDHERGGRPAAVARFLHLNLQLTASLTSDEEQGVMLPGRSGFWVVKAKPLLL